MWQKLSLRARLNALLAVILLFGLAINIARLLVEAGPRVQAEDQSVIRLVREFIESSLVGLNDSPDADARLDRIVEDLNRLRHVSVRRAAGPASPPRPAGRAPGRPEAAPAWFMAMVHPEQNSVRVPVNVSGKTDALVITSHPDDEIDEIWDGIVTQLEVGSAIVVALLLVTMTVVSRALSPIETLAGAMTRIEDGAYDTRIKPMGPPELAAICDKLNHLATTLGGAVEDKRRLAERIVSLQDIERKEIARELHDEFGPYHFALRAHADALLRIAETAGPNEPALRKHGAAMLAQVDALQQFNRRVLGRLRPPGLADLGLGEAIGALVRQWRETDPGVQVETSVASSLPALSETAELTIYRVVQEGLTNAFRHAQASHVEVMVELDGPSGAGRTAAQAIRVRIRDNGAGLRDQKQGFGLVGMHERLMALGGSVSVTSTGEGVIVEAMVPVQPGGEDAALA
ncbi:histidine kinase [Bradyrhizobium sp. WD16]|uniref:histidine kinase n=1 Tax=Bradyrhizobium sp. WD16 TaxID=1521768 RepID=UPI0020A5A8EE|nr:histidine kinase [Bradyrhizobium sp. WD16]UTD28113.1 histidine kinase [Bradyrhizobium sp. WD16]